jgi:hypothetical protein
MQFKDYLRVVRAFQEPVIGHFATKLGHSRHHTRSEC